MESENEIKKFKGFGGCTDCPDCNGQGQVPKTDDIVLSDWPFKKCPTCDGLGFISHFEPAQPEGEGKRVKEKPVAGDGGGG